jgi:hypothetical protein
MTSVKDRLDKVLLQYDAEKKQGLNELAGHGTAREQAVFQLLALFQQEVMAALPEKIKLDTSFYQEDYASERIGYEHGYNDALKDMESRLKERLEQ